MYNPFLHGHSPLGQSAPRRSAVTRLTTIDEECDIKTCSQKMTSCSYHQAKILYRTKLSCRPTWLILIDPTFNPVKTPSFPIIRQTLIDLNNGLLASPASVVRPFHQADALGLYLLTSYA